MNPDQSVFGLQRVLDVVHKNRERSASHIVGAIFSAASDFTQGEPQADDITVVIVKALDP